MRKVVLVTATHLLLTVVLLVVLACGEASSEPTPVPGAEESGGGDQSATQTKDPAPVPTAVVEVPGTQAAASPTPRHMAATGPPQRGPVPPQAFPMPMQVTYVTSRDLGELVAKSTLIAIGTTSEAEPREERVSGRLPGDPSKPDPNYTMIGNVYDVQVERHLKGDIGETLSLIQSIGFDAFVPGPPNTPGRLTQGRNDSLGVRLGKSSRYLLFLREFEDVPGLWSGTAEPYRFLLEGGRAKVESPVGNVRGEFGSRSEEELVSLVDALIAGRNRALSPAMPEAEVSGGPTGELESNSGATATPSPLAPSATSSPTSPAPNSTVSDALLQDASHYAADVGVDLDEAVRRLQAQDMIGELGAELEANEQPTFGGLWIQHKPEYKVVVAFIRDGEETVRPYIQGTSLADMVEVREVEATLAELREAQREAGAILSQLGIRASSGIDITNNVVQMYLSESENEELDAGLKDSGLKLPNKVEVVN